MLKLCYLVAQSGVDYWRSHLPAKYITAKGLAETRVLDVRSMSMQDITASLRWCDAIVPRGLNGTSGYALLLEYQNIARKVFVDYDDWFYDCSPLNRAYVALGLQEIQVTDPKTNEKTWLWKNGKDGFDIKRNRVQYVAFQHIVQDADLITTTTPYLKEKLSRFRNGPTAILPNAIDFKRWKPWPDARSHYPKEQFRVGWAVSDSHCVDLYQMKYTFLKMLEEIPEMKLVVLGDANVDLSAVLPKDRIEQHVWSDLYESHYPIRLATLGLDVAIAPLVDNEFNKCKSPLKYAEYTAIGYPVVASNILPYNDIIIHGENGLLANTQDEWISALKVLQKDESLRCKLKFNAMTTCKALFDIEKVAWQWIKEYNKVLGKKEVLI
jgi:glycosyltransferase involved in cell wall biosynthesis